MPMRLRLLAALLLVLFARPALGACHRFVPQTADRRPPSVRLPQFIVCDLESELPTVDVRAGDLSFSKSSDKLWKRTASSGWSEVGAEGGSGGTWGSITGTLSDQTDLQSALDAKADSPISDTSLGSGTADSTTFLRGDRIWATPPGGGSGLTHPQIMSRVSLGF